MSFEIAWQQNAKNNVHRRTTREQSQRTDVGESQTPRKVMSTPSTGTTNGSAGGSTEVEQSVRLASGGTAGGGTSDGGIGTTTAGTVLLVAGAHVPILHLTESLLSLNGDVPKVLQGVTLEEQHNQATEIYKILKTPSPYLPHFNEGSKCYAALANVSKTSLVKLIYGSIPIGENVSPVDGKLLFFQGNSNADLGPPHPVCLPATVVELNMAVVMTVAQFSTRIISKGAGYLYPLLTRNAVNTSGEIMQTSPIPPYFIYDRFEKKLDTALVFERVMSVNPSINNMFTHLELF